MMAETLIEVGWQVTRLVWGGILLFAGLVVLKGILAGLFRDNKKY